MKLLVAALISTSLTAADQDYLNLLQQFPETMGRFGSWKQGEIEIATKPAEIERIEKHMMQKLLRLGHPPEEAKEYSRIGIIGEDHYWIWVRDAVIFPGGILGTYDRIVRKSGLSGPSGVVILPILPSKKIVVNINFRHATRSWELELPRGKRLGSESEEATALRELKEETGCISKKLTLLGHLPPHSGVVSGTVPVFCSIVGKREERHQDESEAIAKNIELSLKEVQEGFMRGYVIIDIGGNKTKVFCRDPFLSFALLQATWQKLI